MAVPRTVPLGLVAHTGFVAEAGPPGTNSFGCGGAPTGPCAGGPVGGPFKSASQGPSGSGAAFEEGEGWWEEPRELGP